MVCGNFILPEPASYVFFYAVFNLRKLLYIILQSLRFRNFCFHLHDQHLQLLLTLLAGVGVDIAGVLFAIGPLGGVAPLEEVVVDLTDAACSRPALAAHG